MCCWCVGDVAQSWRRTAKDTNHIKHTIGNYTLYMWIMKICKFRQQIIIVITNGLVSICSPLDSSTNTPRITTFGTLLRSIIYWRSNGSINGSADPLWVVKRFGVSLLMFYRYTSTDNLYLLIRKIPKSNLIDRQYMVLFFGSVGRLCLMLPWLRSEIAPALLQNFSGPASKLLRRCPGYVNFHVVFYENMGHSQKLHISMYIWILLGACGGIYVNLYMI